MLSVGEGFSFSSLKTMNLGIRGSELDRTGLLTQISCFWILLISISLLGSGPCCSRRGALILSPCFVWWCLQVLHKAGAEQQTLHRAAWYVVQTVGRHTALPA